MVNEPRRPQGSVSPALLLVGMLLVVVALGLLTWLLLAPSRPPAVGPGTLPAEQDTPASPVVPLDPARTSEQDGNGPVMPAAATTAGAQVVVDRGATGGVVPKDPRQADGSTTYTLTGQVLDDATGKPVPHFAIYLLPTAEGDIRQSRDSSTPNIQARNMDGRFELLFQPTGLYNLLVETITHKDLVVEGVRIPQEQELVLRLQKGTWIHGTVTDDLGTPLARYPVLLHPVQMDPGHAAPRRTRATTDAKGAYQFDKLPPGTYWLSAGAAGNPDAVIQEFYLARDQDLERSFRIPRLVTVKVIVQTPEGTPIPRARVSLMPVEADAGGADAPPAQLKADYSNREGEARLPFVREGSYRLLIQFNQFVTHDEELFISEGNPYLELVRALQRQGSPGR